MKTLVLSERLPLRRGHGANQRLLQVLQTLEQLGSVDFISVPRFHRVDTPNEPERLPATRALVHPSALKTWSKARFLLWYAFGRKPLGLSLTSYDSARAACRAASSIAYDLYWIDRPFLYAALTDLIRGPSIVDFADIQSDLEARLAASRPPASLLSLRAQLRNLRLNKNARLTRATEQTVAESASAVTVCSDTDGELLGTGRRVVVPNGYEPPDRIAGDAPRPSTPVVTMVGTMTYEPNIDAVEFFVNAILPRLVNHLPGLEFRVVGEADARVRRLGDHPNVAVLGFVDDLYPELAKSRAIVVPLRFGSGTRIKILEAFAHKLPVVSTSVGAAGLDVEHEKHMFLADDPAAFARACLLALSHDAGVPAMVERAHRLFLAEYQWPHIRDRIAHLALEVASQGNGVGHLDSRLEDRTPGVGGGAV